MHSSLGQPEAASQTQADQNLLDKECTKLDQMRENIRRALPAILESVAGIEYATFEERKNIACKINTLLIASKTRVICPKEECRMPALLKVGVTVNSREGVFQYQHGSKSTHGGKAILPSLGITFLE